MAVVEVLIPDVVLGAVEARAQQNQIGIERAVAAGACWDTRACVGEWVRECASESFVCHVFTGVRRQGARPTAA